MKRDILRRMYQYVVQLNLQVISKIENGAELLADTDILHCVTADLIAMLKDYYDSVRDQACIVLEYIITHLLRTSPLLSYKNRDLLQILRSSASIGFTD